ncbi:class II aldolase/adducin family protein [Verrucomicrobiota bacterium]
MKSIRDEIVKYGAKITKALVAVSGGSISAREGNKIWIQPADSAMDEMRSGSMCGIELRSGLQINGKKQPSPEMDMHLAVYRARPDIVTVFHTHSPWVIGVISAGKKFRPMFAEFINDLGRTGSVPYFTPASKALNRRIADLAEKYDTIFMVNHGMLTMGVNLKQAFFRCAVAEDAAKSLLAASVVGKPLFFSQKKVREILSLDAVKHRTKMMEKK